MKNNCAKRCSERKLGGLPEDMQRQIEIRLRLQSRENRVSCSAARNIASELGVAAREVGNMADHLDIRINQCQLGCF
ncbi:hypothetical protein [Desulfurivibrio sp. C05AmB]|uniref:hypothetical protein n=1 Tax=Desulfurivibrio sp. C05AmB TaxID=3374371 RepID=UPI00376F356F